MRIKVYDKLLQWKNNDAPDTAVLIDGARRVGKSYVAEQFAKAEYKSHILIDFNIAPSEVKAIFEENLDDLDGFFKKISSYYAVPLYVGETLFIFDEVQEFPRARAAIKYLVADGRYHYLETGSLISIQENVAHIVIPSEEDHIKMYPLDQVTESLITNCFDEGSAASKFAYQQFFTALEQTVEELTKCFLLEFGENREFSYGRCEKARSFNDLYEGLKSVE